MVFALPHEPTAKPVFAGMVICIYGPRAAGSPFSMVRVKDGMIPIKFSQVDYLFKVVCPD